MTGRDLTSLSAPIDDLFIASREVGIHTTGIGDGGNELGMGKVLPLVVDNIKNGAKIACVTETTHLICAGVSNWGGYALVGAIEVLHNDVTSGSLLCSDDEIAAILDHMTAVGAVCGISGKPGVVDGLEKRQHQSVLADIHAIIASTR